MEQNRKEFNFFSPNSKNINVVDLFKILDEKIKSDQTVKNQDETEPVKIHKILSLLLLLL